LNKNNIDAECFTFLAKCNYFTILKYINLSENKIGDHGIVSLGRCSFLNNLKSLMLLKNDVSSDVIKLYESKYDFISFR